MKVYLPGSLRPADPTCRACGGRGWTPAAPLVTEHAVFGCACRNTRADVGHLVVVWLGPDEDQDAMCDELAARDAAAYTATGCAQLPGEAVDETPWGAP